MEAGKLEAEVRTGTGKQVMRKLRQQGKIPAVCYGGGEEPIALTLDPKALSRALDPEKRQNTLITLTVKGDGAERQLTVMLKDFQTHPVRREVLHADFVRVDVTKEVKVTVPVVLTGKAEGVKVGGLMHQVFRELDVACLPDRIPNRVELDVTPLQIGQALHVSDLSFGEGVRALHDPKQSIAVVVAPKAEKTPEEEAAEAAEAAAAVEGAAPAAAPTEGAPAGVDKAAAKAAARAAAKGDKAAE